MSISAPIAPIDKDILSKELRPEFFLRKTNFGQREIYVITAHTAPYVMKEIGRLREICFRQAGGGTGKEVDIDEFDTMDQPYKQLILWDPEAREIIGGYRYMEGHRVRFNEHGLPLLSTGEIFDFSQEFIKNYLPYTIELGRSFIITSAQATKDSRKNIYNLDNLWDGLGGIQILNSRSRYFFGKITMYTSYNPKARDILLYFMYTYYPDKDHLVIPRNCLELQTPEEELEKIFHGINNLDEAYKTMNKKVREQGENVPPLFSSYIKLSPTMKTFGTAVNRHFGNVEETGILVNIDDIYPEKKERHVESFVKENISDNI